MSRQITNILMMIRPANFGFNPVTAENNAFQQKPLDDNTTIIKELAVEEFDRFVLLLQEHQITVDVVEDKSVLNLSDAVFPNNWISFHENGAIITYPMFSEIRRKERREDLVSYLEKKYGYTKRYSFEYFEEKNQFLEGTGSLVLDRDQKVAYACISKRTDPQVLNKWAFLTDYKSIIFNGVDEKGKPIYHTNVMMAIGQKLAIVCLDSIQDEDEKNAVVSSLKKGGKNIIDISYQQMNNFAGNMLEVTNGTDSFLIMSTSAYNSLTKPQIELIESLTIILHSDIQTIEKFGGGSVRCMMAEIFLPSV